MVKRFSAIVSNVNATRRIAVVPGDGIGKEVIAQAVSVVKATGADVAFTEFDWSADRYLEDGTTIPSDGFAMLSRDFDAILVGALGDPRVPSNIHAKEILLGMRFKMDLFANVRPVKCLDDSLCPLKNCRAEDIDFVVVRENTEGPYVDIGGVFKQGMPDEVAVQEDVNTRKGVERVILCSGKVFYDLAEYRAKHEVTDVAIIRVEQLYPLPGAAIVQALEPFEAAASYVWAQQEPANQGPWPFMALNLPEYLGTTPQRVSRRASASPAAGSGTVHQVEHDALITEAFTK